MIRFVREGLKASIIKFKAFRIINKLTGGLTIRVNNARSLTVINQGPYRKVTPSNPKGQVINYQDFIIITKRFKKIYF